MRYAIYSRLLLGIVLLLSTLQTRATIPCFEGCIKKENRVNVVVGMHQGNYSFFEAGISLSRENNPNGCAFSASYQSLSAGVEYNPFQQRSGFTLTATSSAGTFFTMGISALSYTDFNRYNLGIRPMLGIGPGWFSLTYGYTFRLIQPIEPIPANRHTVSLRFHIPIYRSEKMVMPPY